MSWRPTPEHLNRNKPRQPKVETVNPELLRNENVIQIGNDKFTCPKCGGGWTFSRMKTIICNGSDDTVIHAPITFVRT